MVTTAAPTATAAPRAAPPDNDPDPEAIIGVTNRSSAGNARPANPKIANPDSVLVMAFVVASPVVPGLPFNKRKPAE